MVKPSNPRFMVRVLDAVANLNDTKGSLVRDILNFIQQSKISHKNLTIQVHRALKHAVNAGLLRHRGGRYKILATLNATSVSKLSTSKKLDSNDQETEKNNLKSDRSATIGNIKTFPLTQEHKKRTTSRRRNNRHRNSNVKKKFRRTSYIKQSNATIQNQKQRQRRHRNENEKFEDQSSGRYVLHRRNDESSILSHRRAKHSRVSKRELESDFSDESDRESDMSRKCVSRASKSSRRKPRSARKETREKSRDRSAPQVCSPLQLQRATQSRQHPVEDEIGNNKQLCEQDHESTERSVMHQETHKEIEGNDEPNNSNNGSILENS